MADEEEPVVDAPAEEEPAAAAPEEPPMDVETALQKVLKNSLCHDGLRRGLHECCKALDRQEAKLCVLSSGCNEPAYTKLIEALCAEHGVDLMKVSDGKQLGEVRAVCGSHPGLFSGGCCVCADGRDARSLWQWVGLAKVDKEGTARKIVGCSCCVVTDFGEESGALEILKASFAK
jgi:small subunit ribosomal protein S12e